MCKVFTKTVLLYLNYQNKTTSLIHAPNLILLLSPPGVLLNLFTEVGNDLIANKPVSQRLRLVSGHDFNIGSLMEVAHVKTDQSIPEYGAVFALELYRSRSTGAYSVLVSKFISFNGFLQYESVNPWLNPKIISLLQIEVDPKKS